MTDPATSEILGDDPWFALSKSLAVLDGDRWIDEADVVEHPDDHLRRPAFGPTDVALTPAGPELAIVLESIDRDTLSDEELAEVVAAWQRLASWVFLGSARAAASLAGRASMNPSWPYQATRTDLSCTAGDEIAMRLAWSRRAGAQLVRNGRALTGAMLATADALAAGEIDTPKALVLIDRLWNAAPDLADAVQAEVLPRAEVRTPSQLATDVERALVTLSPADADVRHRVARAARRVDRPRRLPDGMAGLWAVLPAESAVEIDAVLEATARTARAAADPRTLDQLRADTLVDILTGRTGCRVEAAPHPDSRSAAIDDDESDADTADAAPTGVRVRRPRIQVNVTVALSTLLALDEEPAELDGYGPLQATQARALALGGVWRRLVTDPTSGAVLDVGRTRYRPPADLADHVRHRDKRCVRPHCSATAEQCDLDHTIEFHGSGGEGTTSAGNLGPVCPRDHRLKTDGGHRLSQPSPGRFEWITPAGLRYLVVPGADGSVERVDRQPRRRAVVLPATAKDPGPPPF
ncbi:HNH endonuclease signature motif containing protein [Cellulomonas sp. ICMP 17802]|uniref:HNH endonuclease signature motif containing protein n=1 Tax=Cellulomonas sp. ICMP 17802 TaxID=3239199 RepID=UPI00351B9E21